MLISGLQKNKTISADFSMHSTIYGKGSHSILTFHGFGQDGSVYQAFEKVIDTGYRLHSFDLPYHGKSRIPVNTDGIESKALRDFFGAYFESEDIRSFILIGYSIGAKFALNLVKFFPEMVDRLILIAPDGLKINFWYRIATGTEFSRNVFRYLMQHPGIFLKFGDLLSFFRLIHPAVNRFVKSQVADRASRELIYDSWVNFRTLNINIREIGKLIETHRIPVDIILGEKDRLIDAEAIRPLIRELPMARIKMLPVGHYRLIEDTAEYFMKEGF
jgi:pimeloyl-ACP methyl ester carboxylesterase